MLLPARSFITAHEASATARRSAPVNKTLSSVLAMALISIDLQIREQIEQGNNYADIKIPESTLKSCLAKHCSYTRRDIMNALVEKLKESGFQIEHKNEKGFSLRAYWISEPELDKIKEGKREQNGVDKIRNLLRR